MDTYNTCVKCVYYYKKEVFVGFNFGSKKFLYFCTHPQFTSRITGEMVKTCYQVRIRILSNYNNCKFYKEKGKEK